MIDLLTVFLTRSVGVNLFMILRKLVKTLPPIVVTGFIVIIWSKYGSTTKNVLPTDMRV